MGLDSGITIRKINEKDIPDFIKYTKYSEEIEIAYWRKCWNIRNKILDVLNPENEDKYSFAIDREDIPAITRVLKPFLAKDYWDNNNTSIWEYKDMIDNNIQVIINLIWLYIYMDDHDDIEIEFYDSY